jgi:hypothetical protein
MKLPHMVKIRQALVSDALVDLPTDLGQALDRAGFERLFVPGRRVAVAVGSRNMDRIGELVTGLIAKLNELGCVPFIVPAMGSHGGATAEGQEGVLAGLGVTDESAGAPVVSSMETVSLGMTSGGNEVFADRAAMESDAIVVVNRVAPHTGYSGSLQSGLCKMLAVGLGKREGAVSLHRHGFGAAHLIGEMADAVLSKAPVVLGIALVEDGEKRLSLIEALAPEEFRAREPELLRHAFSMYPRVPLRSADLLIVDEIGKDISGTGMDPLVTGRGKDMGPEEGTRFSAGRLVALRLTEGSRGNATGIGHADVTTERLVGSIDCGATYKNVLTSGALHRARIRSVAGSEREAVETALYSLGDYSPDDARVVRIRNTRALGEFQVSTALVPELKGRDGIEVGDEMDMEFDSVGNII